jgi:AraC family transcriptional regulator
LDDSVCDDPRRIIGAALSGVAYDLAVHEHNRAERARPMTEHALTGISFIRTAATESNEHAQARIGLRVDIQSTARGIVELEALPEHRLKIHTGRPLRGACSRHPFLYAPGDVDIYPAGWSDVWQQYDASTSIVVKLSPSLLGRAAEDKGLDAMRVGLEPRHHFRDARIEHIACALEAERRANFQNGVIFSESLGLALAIHLLSHYKASARLPRGLGSAQLRRVTRFIDENLDEDLSLGRLAELVHLSASHFKTVFKRSTGVPVHQYVIQRRVERAKTLLARGTMPLAQVAMAAGFAHQSHMARAMRRLLGVTPKAIARNTER